MKACLSRQYDEEDEATNVAKREVSGRVCLQRFLDELEYGGEKAQRYLTRYEESLKGD